MEPTKQKSFQHLACLVGHYGLLIHLFNPKTGAVYCGAGKNTIIRNMFAANMNTIECKKCKKFYKVELLKEAE
jgi:hypothetical protein